MFGKNAAEFPFLLEDRLIQRGANYQKGEAMLPFVVKDKNIITGQNPYSTTKVSEEVIKSLDKTLVPRKMYKDEMSMDLVNKAVAGGMKWAKSALKKDTINFDLQLIAVYGYYQAMFAKDEVSKIKKGVSIMELVIPYFFDENLYLKLAEFYIKINEKPKAVETLNAVIKKNQNSKAANDLLQRILE